MFVAIVLETVMGPDQILDFSISATVVNSGIVLLLLAQQFLFLLIAELVVPLDVLGPSPICSLLQEKGLGDVTTDPFLVP